MGQDNYSYGLRLRQSLQQLADAYHEPCIWDKKIGACIMHHQKDGLFQCRVQTAKDLLAELEEKKIFTS